MTRLINADNIEYHMMAKEDWLGNTVEDSKMVWKADIDSMPTVDAIPVEWIRDYTTRLRNSADHLDNREEHELADIFIYGQDAINFMLMKWKEETK